MDLFGKLGRVFPFWLFFCTQILASPPWAVHGKLQRSANGHYLQHEDGTPFLWMGDTGWGLFGHLDQAEVTQYLDQRQKTGFNVIQTVAYWYPHGGILPDGPHNPANAYGHRPFEGDADHPETSKPLIVADISPDRPDDYWDHADFIIRECKKRGLYLALLPCWGSAYIQSRRPGSRVEFTETEAREYGRFLGERYGQEPHMIWVLGGDIDPIHHGVGDQRMVYRAMAEGIGQAASNNPGLRWGPVSPGLGSDPDDLPRRPNASPKPWRLLFGLVSSGFLAGPEHDGNLGLDRPDISSGPARLPAFRPGQTHHHGGGSL